MLRKPVIAAALLFAPPAVAQDAASFSQDDAAAPDPQDVLTAEMLEDARVVSLEGNYDQEVWDQSALSGHGRQPQRSWWCRGCHP